MKFEVYLGLLLPLSFCLLCNGESCDDYGSEWRPTVSNCSPCPTSAPSAQPGRHHCRFTHRDFLELPLICKSNTKHILLYACCLPDLNAARLANYRSVECLELPFNRISVLRNGTFSKNQNLVKMFISNNKIKEIELGSFKGLRNLTHLDISYNLLTSINGKTFSYCPNLKELYLSGNSLTSVDSLFALQNPSIVFPSLRLLVLSNNSITVWTVTSLTKLTDLDLSLNQLTEWTEENSKTIPSIRRLNLSNNSLAEVGKKSLENNRHLSILDLSNNRIRSLDKNFLINLCSLTSIRLNGNQLQEAHPEWFAAIAMNFKSGKRDDLDVRLENNQWNCDCKFKKMKDFYGFLEGQPDYKIKGNWKRHINFKCIQSDGATLQNVNLDHCPGKDKASFLTGICREMPVPLESEEGDALRVVFPLNSVTYALSILIPVALILLFVIASCVWYRRSSSKTRAQDQANHPQNTPANRLLPSVPETPGDTMPGYINV